MHISYMYSHALWYAVNIGILNNDNNIFKNLIKSLIKICNKICVYELHKFLKINIY